jgi:hypothetical protein
VLASRKAVATQENVVPRLSASEMVGKAVFVTLPSSAESSNGKHIATKERQKPLVRVHSSEGVLELSEGCDSRAGRIGQPFSDAIFESLVCCWKIDDSPSVGDGASECFSEEAFDGKPLAASVTEDVLRMNVAYEAFGDCTAVSAIAKEYWLGLGWMIEDRLEEDVDCGKACIPKTKDCKRSSVEWF